MTYNEFIQNILDTRGRFNVDGYKERHHIIPECLGGTDDEENLIDLYAREHFIAHKLLAEENPDNYKLNYALWCMATLHRGRDNQEAYILTPEEYEEVRLSVSKSISIKQIEYFSNIESREKLSKSQKERYKNNPQLRKNASERAKKRSYSNSSHHTKVRCITTGEVFETIREASEKYNVYQNNITHCCKGELKTTGGYSWEYVIDN